MLHGINATLVLGYTNTKYMSVAKKAQTKSAPLRTSTQKGAKEWHHLKIKEVLRALNSSHEGLDQEEVTLRTQKSGANTFSEVSEKGIFMRFYEQLKGPLAIVLVAAFLVTLSLGEFVDASVIAFALLVAVGVGVVQEGRASRAFKKLSQSQSHTAMVTRGGKKHVIPSSDLVPGDIVKIESGMQVPADVRIIESKSLTINESVLTGEWLAVNKNSKEVAVGADVTAQHNMAFMGTFVSDGYGTGVVVRTGDNTLVGRLAQNVQNIKDEKTPLQVEIARVSHFMLIVIMVIVSLIFILGVVRGEALETMLLTSIAVAVASVPEGLPAAVTIILAIGMESLLRRGGLVRNLLAAETLGSTTYVLTDKTGTLTKAQMSITDVVHKGGSGSHLKDDQWKENGMIVNLFDVALCASDAFVDEGEEEEMTVTGDPMERAILHTAADVGVSTHGTTSRALRIDYLAFNSENRFAAGLTKVGNGYRVCLNGSPEYILTHATHIMTEEGVRKMTDNNRAYFKRAITAHTKRGERLIAVAYRDVGFDDIPTDIDETFIEKNTFLGLLVFHDPVRGGVKEAIAEVKEAGARVVLVTGDNPQTALTIARTVDIATEKDTALLGVDVEKMDEAQLLSALHTVPVFARVLPQQKMRLATVLQKHGEIVAMTGDGVNDAPALRKANIGIALGSGTEVAKEASDLVLVNDSFEIILSAIEEGRRIVSNLRKIVGYLLATSFSEVLLIGGALLAGFPVPLTAAQILWANIIEEGLMSVAFAFEPGEKRIMRQKPEDVYEEGILSRDMLYFMGVVVTIMGLLLIALYAYLVSLDIPLSEMRSAMFLAVAIDSLFIAFAFRSLTVPFWRISLKTNLFFLGSFLVSASLLAIVLTIPFFQFLLSYEPLPLRDIVLVGLFGVLTLAAIEASKWIFFERKARS